MRKPEKPDVGDYLPFVLRLYRDLAARCSISASTADQDVKTLTARATSEGMTFLTRTLPSLGKCLDKALASDIPLTVDATSFALSKHPPYAPLFLGGYWQKIFDVTGRLKTLPASPTTDANGIPTEQWDGDGVHPQASAEMRELVGAVSAIRQICFLLYKLEGSHSEESEAETITTFVEVDKSLPQMHDDLIVSSATERALENARLLAHRVLGGSSRESGLNLLNIVPGHGPGAVATGEKPWKKMNFSRFYEKLDEKYSYADYFYFNYTHLCDNLESLEGLTTLHAGTAKVVLVPKDSRGPRLISMEPLELQWIQQGQNKALVKQIESSSLTRGRVNFTDQLINRRLAKFNSMDGGYATIDMKEASDRVSCWLVNKVLPREICEYLHASRSLDTLLPTGELLTLRKFAPMGSSVCFPVEALIFWCLAVGTLKTIRTSRDFKDLPDVYVYGDDIILPKQDVDVVERVFNECHLVLNKDKCCTGRFFRESCGMDAFLGCPVIPIRVKKRLNDSSPQAILSHVSYSNSLRRQGYDQAADYLQQHVTRKFGSVPILNRAEVHPLAFVDTKWTNDEVIDRIRSNFKVRYNKAYQREEVLLPCFIPPLIKRGEPDWQELLRLRPRGDFDPFGFDPPTLPPCLHTMPDTLKFRRVWVGLYDLLKP